MIMKLKKFAGEYILPMLMTYILVTMVFVLTCYIISTNSAVNYHIEIWQWGSGFITFFLPVIAVLPFSFILFGKVKHGFAEYAGIRKSKKYFIKQEVLKGMIASGTTVFAIFFTTLVIVLLFMEPTKNWNGSNLSDYPFGHYQINMSLIFGFFWSLWLGVISSLFMLFSSLLTLYLNNFFVVSLAPFVYLQAENLVTALLTVPRISLTTTINLNRLTPSAMEPYTYLIGACTFFVVIISVSLLAKWHKGKIYEQY